MKVALILSGQPRYVEQCFPTIDKCIIQPNSPDIFCHIWHYPGMENQPFRIGSGWKDQRVTPNAPKVIEKLYNPKTLMASLPWDMIEHGQDYAKMNEGYPKIDFTKSLSSGYAGGAERSEIGEYYHWATRNMWYSTFEAAKLMIRNGQYDVVIKCRFDLGITKVVKMSDYDQEKLWHESLGRPDLMNNWFNFSKWDNMLKYCSIDPYAMYEETGIWCNEYFVRKMCEKNNIIVGEDYFGLTLPSFPL